MCAFNCGFILYDSWEDSLPHMIRWLDELKVLVPVVVMKVNLSVVLVAMVIVIMVGCPSSQE